MRAAARRRSRPARASVTSALAAARSSTRRSAAPLGGSSSGTPSSSVSDIDSRSASGWVLCTSSSRSSANNGSTSSSGSSIGRWMIAALSCPESTPGHDGGRAALADDRVHARVAGRHRAQQLRHQPAGRGADDADPGVARHVVVERGDVGGDVVDLVQHAPGPLDHTLALVGEAAVGAVDQGDAELAFELGHVARTRSTAPCTAPSRRPRTCRDRPRRRWRRAGGRPWRTLAQIHLKNRFEVSLSSTCQMHVRTCIVSQTRTTREDPPSSARRRVHESVPHRRAFQVETPRSPIGAFPVFRRCRLPVSPVPSRCSRLRPVTAIGGDASSHVGTPAAGAAFFDLDRTLAARGQRRGVLRRDARRRAGEPHDPGREVPLQPVQHGRRDAAVDGARPSGRRVRQGPLATARCSPRPTASPIGWWTMVQPFADGVFEMHRAAGRPVVLATTTPFDLVKPFADRLGLDDVIATRYGVHDDGDTYDGTLDGPFVWSAGKLEAVRAWADEHDIDLAESWFYSDSVYDTPLMSVVGNPVVVNPDPRMVFMAAARRWPTLNLDVSPGVRQGAGRRPGAAAAGDGVHPPVDGAVRRHRHPRRRAHPATRPGDPRRQPPLVLRPDRDGDGARQGRPHGPLPRQEGGVRRARCSARSPRRWAASASTAAPAPTSRSRPPPRRCWAARSSR